MSRHLEFPRPVAWDLDYWLCRCEGFRVDAPTERVGVVEAIRFGSRVDRPDELLVRGGVLGTRRIVIDVTDVEEVVPRQQRLVLRCTPERDQHRLARLRAHVSRNAQQATR
jgi:hypothetical protein